MSSSLSVEIRDGYQELARRVDEGDRRLVTRARVLSYGGRAARVEALVAVVAAYRAGPTQLWGPVLLELLAPSILARLRRLKPQPPAIDLEDVRQQLVLEVLLAAAEMPLPENRNYLRSRLMARANQGLRRQLARERRRQHQQIRLEDDTEDGKRASSSRSGAGNQ
jgi:hypothetical protein